MSKIVPVRFRALGAVNRTKTSLFDSKLIIIAPARISAQGFSGIYGIYVVSMSLSACMMHTCQGAWSVAAGCGVICQHHVN